MPTWTDLQKKLFLWNILFEILIRLEATFAHSLVNVRLVVKVSENLSKAETTITGTFARPTKNIVDTLTTRKKESSRMFSYNQAIVVLEGFYSVPPLHKNRFAY